MNITKILLLLIFISSIIFAQKATVSAFVGGGAPGFANGNGIDASLDGPNGLCIDKSGNVYIADQFNNCIRKATAEGNVTTFAGSKTVGLLIQKNAAIVQVGQVHVKRCIIEMGGKNASIVFADAAVPLALFETLFSSFVTTGQRCTATSRLIVVDDGKGFFDTFVQELSKHYNNRIKFINNP